LLADDSLILRMRANLKPDEPICSFDGEGSIVQPNSGGPESPDLLEMYRRMLRILFRELEALVGERLDVAG